MFQFTGFRSLSGDRISSAGFPHSGTCESMLACNSSQLFAAFRALLRLDTPRHPPYALCSFTSPFYPNVLFLLSCAIFKEPFESWWVWEDLNFRPHAYQACALTG